VSIWIFEFTTIPQLLTVGGVMVLLMLVGTFCWCRREQCRRDSRTALIRDYRDLLLALRSDDSTPPSPTAHLERVRPPPDQIGPPGPG
jgi:hypothetical protein